MRTLAADPASSLAESSLGRTIATTATDIWNDSCAIDELEAAHFPDFVRAFEPDGLAPTEFDTFLPTVRTLRAFIASYPELLHLVTDAALPNPDLGPS